MSLYPQSLDDPISGSWLFIKTQFVKQLIDKKNPEYRKQDLAAYHRS